MQSIKKKNGVNSIFVVQPIIVNSNRIYHLNFTKSTIIQFITYSMVTH